MWRLIPWHRPCRIPFRFTINKFTILKCIFPSASDLHWSDLEMSPLCASKCVAWHRCEVQRLRKHARAVSKMKKMIASHTPYTSITIHNARWEWRCAHNAFSVAFCVWLRSAHEMYLLTRAVKCWVCTWYYSAELRSLRMWHSSLNYLFHIRSIQTTEHGIVYVLRIVVGTINCHLSNFSVRHRVDRQIQQLAVCHKSIIKASILLFEPWKTMNFASRGFCHIHEHTQWIRFDAARGAISLTQSQYIFATIFIEVQNRSSLHILLFHRCDRFDRTNQRRRNTNIHDVDVKCIL